MASTLTALRLAGRGNCKVMRGDMICSWTSSNRWEETRYMCVSPLDITYFGPTGCCKNCEKLITWPVINYVQLAKGLGIQSLCQKNPRIDTIVIQPEKKGKEGPTDWVQRRFVVHHHHFTSNTYVLFALQMRQARCGTNTRGSKKAFVTQDVRNYPG